MSEKRDDSQESAAAAQEPAEETMPVEPDPDGTVALDPDPDGEPQDAADPAADPGQEAAEQPGGRAASPKWIRSTPTFAGVLIGVLLALLGFTLVVQVKSNAGEDALASYRESDLLQILSDLDSAERRLERDIAALEQTKRDLQSGVSARDAALEEAKERADTLGILAGTLKARGQGLWVRIYEQTGRIDAGTLLDAVQELRGAGAEALQIDGAGGSVRIIASTSFSNTSDGVLIDRTLLKGPYTIRAIGDPTTMGVALEIAGGVRASVEEDGGTLQHEPSEAIEINAIRSAPDLTYARPVK